MAYNALNNLIDAYIYANGVQAITGQILNGVLKQMVSQLGSGYHLMGVAGPETIPEQNDYAMAYFAATAGEYTAFGGITLAAGEVAVLLTYGNGSWAKQTVYNVPTGTADLENTANFITNAVTDLVNYYTKTEIDTTLEDYPTLAALATALSDYYTKVETDTKLADYYKKTETYDKDEVDSIVAALSRQEYIVAWDGLAAPDVSAIPAGVTVTYSGTPYTGTLAASASTVNKIYMVWNGVAYDMYGTSQDGGYSWVPMGTTTVDLSQYATKAEVEQLELKVDLKSEVVDLLGTASGVSRTINFDNYTKYRYFVNSSGVWAEATNDYSYSVIIPITPGTFTITAGSTMSIYAFLTAIPVAETAVNYGTVNGVLQTSRITILAGQSATYQVLDTDTSVYLVVRDDVGSGALRPTIVYEADVELYVPLKTEFNALAEDVAENGIYVESEGWIRMVTDSDGKILAGIKKDGTVEWSRGVPSPVSTELATKVDKVVGMSLMDSDFSSSLSVEDVRAWLQVTTDSEGKVIEGITKDGKKKIMVDTEIDGVDIKELQAQAAGNYPTVNGKTIVCFGDSITMFKYGTPERNYPMWMQELSNATVIGCGFGGTRLTSRMTPTLSPATFEQASAPFDIVNLVKYICNNDYTYLDAGLSYIVNNESAWLSSQFSETLNRVKAIDWSTVECVTILAGTNDWSSSTPIGNISDVGDATLYGAIFQIISTLLSTYNHLKLYVLTPLVRYINYNEPNEKFSDDTTLPNYVQAIITASENLKQPVCDMYHTLGWNQYNFSNYFLDTDGTHPYKGFKAIAEKVLKFVNGN